MFQVHKHTNQLISLTISAYSVALCRTSHLMRSFVPLLFQINPWSNSSPDEALSNAWHCFILDKNGKNSNCVIWVARRMAISAFAKYTCFFFPLLTSCYKNNKTLGWWTPNIGEFLCHLKDRNFEIPFYILLQVLMIVVLRSKLVFLRDLKFPELL